MTNNKPHKGSIKNWYRYYFNEEDYIIKGVFDGHPNFDGLFGHTSKIIDYDEKTGEVETLNSRYTLIGDHKNIKSSFQEDLEMIQIFEKRGYKVTGHV